MNKIEIRKKIFNKRKLNKFQNLRISLNALLTIIKKEKIRGKLLGGYYPFNYELDILKTLKELETRNFEILLPKIRKNSQMNYFKWSTDDPLTINTLGVPEPIAKKKFYPDIILVPLVAFDKNLNRIGYGGGFYDRYIKKIKKIKKILTVGLAYSFQKVKIIPTNKNDMKLDYIITEKDR